MAADVRACVLSLSARAVDGTDAAYLEWHGLDHLPEQYSVAEIVHGQRWVSTPECRAARAAGDPSLDAVDHVVQYLFADPVAPALDRFFALGAELRSAGRMPALLPPVELAAYALVERTARDVRAEVLPWRPCRGAYILATHAAVDLAELTGVEGVAGVWRYEGGSFHDRLADTTDRHLAVCYLDRDPVATGRRITEALTAPVLLGAPFVSVVAYDWEKSLP